MSNDPLITFEHFITDLDPSWLSNLGFDFILFKKGKGEKMKERRRKPCASHMYIRVTMHVLVLYHERIVLKFYEQPHNSLS